MYYIPPVCTVTICILFYTVVNIYSAIGNCIVLLVLLGTIGNCIVLLVLLGAISTIGCYLYYWVLLVLLGAIHTIGYY